MKYFTVSFFAILTFSSIAVNAQEKEWPIVKVYRNDLKKIYTVFFADTISKNVTVSLVDKRGSSIIEESFDGKGFSKPYGLSELRNGSYSFIVTFDDTRIEEPIELKNPKDLIEPSVIIESDYPSLKIRLTQQNTQPVNILIMNLEEELLKMYYWEPQPGLMEKEINLSSFEGYEVIVQVQQEGEDDVEEIVNLY